MRSEVKQAIKWTTGASKYPAMIQTRLSLLRNKFFFLLGIVIFLSIFFLALNTFQSNETELLQKIEKLELQNEAYNKQLEGSEHLTHSLIDHLAELMKFA